MEDSILRTPDSVQSPFLADITECRASMRRLRKKIYKYTATHRENRKPKTPVAHDILLLLKERNLPSFVIDHFSKKRTFDIASIKNVNVSHGATLQEISTRALAQENEIQTLFTEHKNRLANEPHLKFDRRPTSAFQSMSWEEERSGSAEQLEQDWCHNIHVSEFRLNEEEPMPLGNLFESNAHIEEHEWFTLS